MTESEKKEGLDKFLKELENLNLTIKEFGEIADIKYSTVSKFGKQNPVPRWVFKFLKYYKDHKVLKDFKEIVKNNLCEKID